MKFVDELVITVESGKGGDGMVAFRREKFVPFGGPSGGDGGRGGDVIIEATSDFTTLYELSFKRNHKASPGVNGGAKDMDGAFAEPLVVRVPVGTLIYDHETGDLLCDLSRNGQRRTVSTGGRGGRGNSKFATSVRRTPRIAEKGEPGQKFTLRLQLKLLADVGLVGKPNAGKSTFIRSVSNAKPKVADYPFTTLVPCLGIVKPEGIPSFCIADIPGLIEGAHSGAGLGVHFLKHIERTRFILHLVDLSDPSQTDQENPLESLEMIMGELKQYDSSLLEKPMAVVATKMDLPEAREKLPAFKEAAEAAGYKVFPVSSPTGEGTMTLLKHVAEELSRIPVVFDEPPVQSVKVFEYQSKFEISQIDEGRWRASGREIEKILAMSDLETEEGIVFFITKLKRIGFIDELKALDGEPEDIIEIGDVEFRLEEFML